MGLSADYFALSGRRFVLINTQGIAPGWIITGRSGRADGGPFPSGIATFIYRPRRARRGDYRDSIL
jgi:hypothetical protein